MKLSGVWLVFIFTLLSAIREVYVGNLVQTVNPALVVFVSLLVTTLIFLGGETFRKSEKISQVVKRDLQGVLFINFTTALSWIGLFYALKFIEPAVAAVLSTAVGPVATFVFLRIFSKKYRISKAETFCTFAISLSLIGVAWFNFGGFNGLAEHHHMTTFGLILAIVCGVGNVGNNLASKRLYHKGFLPRQVMAIRFPFLLFFSIMMSLGHWAQLSPKVFFILIAMGILGVAFPLYVLQLGIRKTDPLNVAITVTLMPLLVFLFQFFDNRIVFSFATGASVTITVFFVLLNVYLKTKEFKKT